MTAPNHEPPPDSRRRPAGLLQRLLGAVGRGLPGVVVLALGGAAWWWLATHHFTATDHGEADQAAGEPAAGRVAIVTLGPGAARDEITLTKAERRPLRAHLTVPGRLDYDARSRLDYDSPVDGIVSKVCVEVRQQVAKGDSLAEVTSPEVGSARDEVKRREDDREIARKAAEWSAAIADNVQSLLGLLEGQPLLADVERDFDDRVLGDYREKIIGAYSRLLYVEKVNAGTKQLGDGGVLSGRIVEERTSNLEVARASFHAVCESARFDILQERDKARAELMQAERLVQVSKENLRTLVGSRLETEEGSSGQPTADEGEATGAGISGISLRTPFAGVIEEVFVSRGERVRGGDRMFVVADTNHLWVRAQVHEKQWTTVDVTEGQEVRVSVPGSSEHRTIATINHVAATVDPASRSVPIVADLTNDDAHYKPGMFVWVQLPQGVARDVVAVPAAAVMRHEGKAFVFVPVEGGFRRTDIDTGIETDDFIEVTRGLESGQEVVERGAFVLKSELLLEDEG